MSFGGDAEFDGLARGQLYLDLPAQHERAVCNLNFLNKCRAIPSPSFSKLNPYGQQDITRIAFWMVMSLAAKAGHSAMLHTGFDRGLQGHSGGFHRSSLIWFQTLECEREFTALFSLLDCDVKADTDV